MFSNHERFLIPQEKINWLFEIGKTYEAVPSEQLIAETNTALKKNIPQGSSLKGAFAMLILRQTYEFDAFVHDGLTGVHRFMQALTPERKKSLCSENLKIAKVMIQAYLTLLRGQFNVPMCAEAQEPIELQRRHQRYKMRVLIEVSKSWNAFKETMPYAVKEAQIFRKREEKLGQSVASDLFAKLNGSDRNLRKLPLFLYFAEINQKNGVQDWISDKAAQNLMEQEDENFVKTCMRLKKKHP